MFFNKFRRFILYFRGLFQGRGPTSEKRPLSDKTKEEVRKNTDTASNFVEPQKRLEDENGAKIALKKSDLEVELLRSHQTIQSLRVQEDSMKEELENLKNKLLLAEEKAELFESRYQEEHVKNKELENELQEVLSSGSIPISQYERKVTALENELSECQEKLMKLTGSFEATSANESKIHEENEKLKSAVSKLLERYKEMKKEIREEKPTRKSPLLNDEQNLPSNATVVRYKCHLTLPYRGPLPDVPDTQGEIPGENITLGQFKSSLSENLRYFFKTPREDLGLAAVLVEVNQDSQVLPLWEGQLLCVVTGQYSKN